MADWDDEGFEPGEIEARKGDEWEGEDEDDDSLKENWDDDEEENDKPDGQTETKAVVGKKKKSTVKKRILEKEEQMKEEALRKAKLKEEQENDEEDDEESIFASELAEKLKRQKLVEEADLQVAKDLFGGEANMEGSSTRGEANLEGSSKSIDTFKPTNKDEFNELAKMLVEKLSQFESSVEYPGFLEVLLRDIASGMEADEVKKLASVLNFLASEKQKAQKAVKAKKKGKKAVLGGSNKGTKTVDLEDYSTYGDEYDDFI